MKTTQAITLLGIMAVVLVALQVALSSLPNVEVVSLLFILLALIFPLTWSLSLAFIFTLLEMLVWGYGDWVLSYFIAWPLLVILATGLKTWLHNEKRIAIFSGLFGFSFGLYSAIVHAALYGIEAGISYFLAGVWFFDSLHGIANFTLALILSKPLYTVILSLYQRMRGTYVNHN